MRYSTFRHFKDNAPVMHEVADWSEFVLKMAGYAEQRPANKITKELHTPCISPAVYTSVHRRKNEHVAAWGGWIAIDVDNDGPLLPVTIEESLIILQDLGLNYLIYASTKSRPDQHRYRIVMPLSREIAAEEITAVWHATIQFFQAVNPDPSCKDISRIYTAPATWVAAIDGNETPHNAFEFFMDGKALDVDAVLAAYIPTPEPVYMPVVSMGVVLEPKPFKQASAGLQIVREKLLAKKSLPTGHCLMNSPVVSAGMIEWYLTLPKGGHHTGLYTFMTKIAGRAKNKGIIITANDLIQYAREMDSISPVKTAAERWRGKIVEEAERAIRFSGHS
jgi:hypothetical protein